MESAGGPQAKSRRSKRPCPLPDAYVEEKHTSGGYQSKRGRADRLLRGFDVEEKQEMHTISSPLTRSTRSISNKNGGHQTIGGSPPPRTTRSKISTAQSTDANGLACDRKTDRGMLHEVPEKHPGILSQIVDAQKKAYEGHILEITNLRHESRSLHEERSLALQKSNEILSLRVQLVCQNVIAQLEAGLENFVDDVDHGFDNCFKELKANKSSLYGVKRGFGNCLQEIRRINGDTPLLIVDLQKSSAEHDSSEKILKPGHDYGGYLNQVGQLKEANGLVCGVECSTSPQPFPDHANRGSRKIERNNLFYQVAAVIRDRQVTWSNKIPIVFSELSRFLEGQETAHNSEIANIRAQCCLLLEKTTAQLEAGQIYVDEVEQVFNNIFKELEAARISVCGVKRRFNHCLQQVREIKSDTPVLTSVHLHKSSGEQNFSVKSKPYDANGEMSGVCGSYADDGATPTLLQAALSHARLAVNRLENVVSKVKKSRGEKSGPKAAPDVFFALPNHSGYYVNSVVNRLFFEGFENESFNTLLGVSRFLNPNLRKQSFYEYFLRERERLYANDIEDPQFEEFCQAKISSLLGILLPECTGTRMEINSLEELGDPQLASSFRGAARRVWLLHKLAFSLEPPATIFRVEAGVDVDPEYMETIVDLDENENFVSKVGFMIAPGLRVRKTIMKCEVYLAAATKTPN